MHICSSFVESFGSYCRKGKSPDVLDTDEIKYLELIVVVEDLQRIDCQQKVK